MDENPDIGSLPVSDSNDGARTALVWLAQHFPQVAATLGDAGADFASVTDAWHRDAMHVDNFLEYQSRFATGMDDRTRGAHLVAFYSHHLGVAAGAIYLISGMVPDLDPDSLGVRFEPYNLKDPDGIAEHFPADARRFHFRFGRLHRHPDGASLFHDGFVASLARVVEALKVRTGLSSVAQWRLAADGIAGAFLEIGTVLADEERAMASALAIVKKQGSPLSANALRYERIGAVVDGAPVKRTFRLRSGCCLYYRTEGGRCCDVCVLLDGQAQKNRLRAYLEHAGG